MLLDLNIKNAICASSDSIRTNVAGLAIKGSVKEKGAPIPCRVRLFEKLSGRLLEDVLTDNEGNYEFSHLTKTKFFIVAHHPENQFNAVIQDNVVPK